MIPARNLREIISQTQPGACSQAFFQHECAQVCEMISCLDLIYLLTLCRHQASFRQGLTLKLSSRLIIHATPGQSLGNPCMAMACAVEQFNYILSNYPEDNCGGNAQFPSPCAKPFPAPDM